MLAKLILLIAALVILAALITLCVRAGIKIGEGRQSGRRRAIDPTTYYELANFARLVLGAQPVDDPAYIPEWMKEEGKPLLKKIGTARRTVR